MRIYQKKIKDKRTFCFDHYKTEFEIELSTNDEHIIVEKYRLLLKFEKEE